MSTTMTPDHPHNWAIAAPNGPTSTGICRTCGEAREFKNFMEYLSYRERQRKTIPELVAIRRAAAKDWEEYHGRSPNQDF